MKCKLLSCLILTTTVLISCAQNSAKEAITLNAGDFKEAILKKGVQVLDVRTAAEFNGGHIEHALQANWLDKKEFADRTQHLDKSTPIYVYCQAGGRSASAQNYLKEQGYNVINLEGGMSNWKMNNFPVEGNGDKPQMRLVDFEKIVASNEYVLVDVGADWCPPCRKMSPVLAELKQKPAHPFYFLAVDGGNDIDVMKSIHSDALPTFIVYKNGKEIWRNQGITDLATLNAALK
jgi:predicted bacteriocin transport accessory protein